MAPDCIAAVLEYLRPAEVPEALRARDLFVRCGMMEPAEAEAWRAALRGRMAKLSAPEAEA